MIRFILKWLGYAFIAFGAVQVVLELFYYFQAYQVLQQDPLTLFTAARLKGMGVGLANVAFGAIMVGVYEILVKADKQNVTPMKAKKDLGNWPPSV